MAKKAVHGSGSMEALEAVLRGERRQGEIVSADVLDAWYPPSPKVLDRLRELLPLLVSASPPTHGDGLRSAIAGARGIEIENVLVGSGSSSLMFLAIPRLVSAGDRVMVLDPMYGEYAHIAEHVVGATVERFDLPLTDFRVDVEELARRSRGVKLLAMVNPNSPTGVAVSRGDFERLMGLVDQETFVWVDETYVDFYSIESGVEQSVEELVGRYPNLIVSKSMSKFYALSGLRVGYLVAGAELVEELELYSPPWSVGTLATVAAEQALGDSEYYRGRALETQRLRAGLVEGLEGLGIVERVVEGVGNYVLVRLSRPVATELVGWLAERFVFIRDCASLSPRFKNETVRISVLDEDANRRVVAALAEFLA